MGSMNIKEILQKKNPNVLSSEEWFTLIQVQIKIQINFLGNRKEKEKAGLDKERSKCNTVHYYYYSLPPGKKCSEVWGAPTVASKLYKIS